MSRFLKDFPVKKIYKRDCPSCGNTFVYKRRESYIRAERNNSRCCACNGILAKDREISEKSRLKLSIGQLGSKGSGWKGGVNKINNTIRNLSEYKKWRLAVYIRDSFTCASCRNTGGKLNAHHLISVSSLIAKHRIKTTEEALACKDLWNLSNGITLCELCHDKLHKTKGYCKDGGMCQLDFTNKGDKNEL